MSCEYNIGFKRFLAIKTLEDDSVVITIYEKDSKKYAVAGTLGEIYVAIGFHRRAIGTSSQRSASGIPDTHQRQALRIHQLQAEMADGGPTRVLLRPRKRTATVEDRDMSSCGTMDKSEESHNTAQQRTRVRPNDSMFPLTPRSSLTRLNQQGNNKLNVAPTGVRQKVDGAIFQCHAV